MIKQIIFKRSQASAQHLKQGSSHPLGRGGRKHCNHKSGLNIGGGHLE